jgi:hypothetical protein
VFFKSIPVEVNTSCVAIDSDDSNNAPVTVFVASTAPLKDAVATPSAVAEVNNEPVATPSAVVCD